LSTDDRVREIWNLNQEDIIPVPAIVREFISFMLLCHITVLIFQGTRLREISEVLGQDPTNEAMCRWTLDVILQTLVRMEQQHMATHDPSSIEKYITLTAEAHLELNVKYKGEDYLLYGKSDYSIWYDDRQMSTNTIICEANDREGVSGCVPQCLAYMGKLEPSFKLFVFFFPCPVSTIWMSVLIVLYITGMVHHIRKQEGCLNTVVYGFVSDGNEFIFLRIDNESKVRIYTDLVNGHIY
jgi:hypothetical protein